MRLRRALAVAVVAVSAALAASACTEEKHTAVWMMSWSWSGATRAAEVVDPGEMCGASARHDSKLLVLLRTARLDACDAWCAEKSSGAPTPSCRLECNAQATFAGGACTTLSTKEPILVVPIR